MSCDEHIDLPFMGKARHEAAMCFQYLPKAEKSQALASRRDARFFRRHAPLTPLPRVAPENHNDVTPLTPTGAGVESFPRTLPQSLCHSRNAATGRTIAHVAEAAGPPHVESYAHGDGFQVAQVPAPVAIYSYGCARLGGGARGQPSPHGPPRADAAFPWLAA